VYLDDVMRARLSGLAATLDSGAGLLSPAESGAGLRSPDGSEDGLRPAPGVRGAYTVGDLPPWMIRDGRRRGGALIFPPSGALCEYACAPTALGRSVWPCKEGEVLHPPKFPSPINRSHPPHFKRQTEKHGSSDALPKLVLELGES
jgi:hypothetical protein